VADGEGQVVDVGGGDAARAEHAREKPVPLPELPRPLVRVVVVAAVRRDRDVTASTRQFARFLRL
jgi:hypothetical protein